MSEIVCYYNKNLRMSPGKLAAQVAHAVVRLCGESLIFPEDLDKVIVLEARDRKFKKLLVDLPKQKEYYIHHDLGITEVEEGTPTVIAFIKN